MFARHVTIDIACPPDEVVARLRGRLRGGLDWGTELMLPTTKVGKGPPDFLGRIAGRSFRLYTTWRPNFAVGYRSGIEVIGLVEATGPGAARIRAVLRPRSHMYWMFALPVIAMIPVLWRVRLSPEPLVVLVVVGLYWLSIVRHDIQLTALGLSALVAPPPASATPSSGAQ